MQCAAFFFLASSCITSSHVFAITAVQYAVLNIEAELNALLTKAKTQPLSFSDLFDFHHKLIVLSKHDAIKSEKIKQQFEQITRAKTQHFQPGIEIIKTAKIQSTSKPHISEPEKAQIKEEVLESDTLDALLKRFRKIVKQIEQLPQLTIEARMDSRKGYWFLISELNNWWNSLEEALKNKLITEMDLFEYEPEKYKNEVFKELIRLLAEDFTTEFGVFSVEKQPGESSYFPYYQITRIKDATKGKIHNFLESKDLYGNAQIKKDLDEKFIALYSLLEKGNIKAVLEDKTVSNYFKKLYKHVIVQMQLRIYGKETNSSPTYNESSLTSLVLALFTYINTIVTDPKKIEEYYTKYVKHLEDVLSDYAILFSSIFDTALYTTILKSTKNLYEDIMQKKMQKSKLKMVSKKTGAIASKKEMTDVIPEFVKGIKAGIETYKNDKKALTEEIVTNKKVAQLLDYSLCDQEMCTTPFQKALDETITEQEKQTGIAISNIVSQHESTVNSEKVEKNVHQDIAFYGLQLQESMEIGPKIDIGGKDQPPVMQKLTEISTQLSKLNTELFVRKMDSSVGYAYVLNQIVSWWSEIEVLHNKQILTLEQYTASKKAKNEILKQFTQMLGKDLQKIFSQFTRTVSQGIEVPFPYGHITRIREATGKKIPDALESKELYGSSTMKDVLYSEFQDLFALLERGGLKDIFENSTILELFIKNHKDVAEFMLQCLAGKKDILDDTHSAFSLAALILEILEYLIIVVKDPNKIAQYLEEYIEKPQLLQTFANFASLFDTIEEGLFQEGMMKSIIEIDIENKMELLRRKMQKK